MDFYREKTPLTTTITPRRGERGLVFMRGGEIDTSRLLMNVWT
jgi:hypothetical protein